MQDTNTKAFVIISVAALVVAAAFSYLFFGSAGPKSDDETFAEEFGLVLKDYNGNDVRLSEFRRKVLIVYAWASWCPYCGEELKNLAQLKRAYGDEVQILAVNRAEPLPDAKGYTDGLGVAQDLVLLMDPNDTLYKDIGGYAMPETIFIDEQGAITFHQRGPIQLAAVEEKIQEILR
jgi:thiol-disulfide isomerase/thioredoxin